MIDEEIPAFGRSHDPDTDVARNVEIGGMLRRVKGTFDHVEVALDIDRNTDIGLVISAIGYNPTEQIVSWRQTGGVRTAKWIDDDGVTQREGYLIRVRVFMTDGRHEDQSAIQLIHQH